MSMGAAQAEVVQITRELAKLREREAALKSRRNELQMAARFEALGGEDVVKVPCMECNGTGQVRGWGGKPEPCSCCGEGGFNYGVRFTGKRDYSAMLATLEEINNRLDGNDEDEDEEDEEDEDEEWAGGDLDEEGGDDDEDDG
jgi:hypothetical protein